MATTSFTPTVSFGGGNTGITYTTQNAVYSRIGQFVYVSILIVLSSKGSSTGDAECGGLPYSIDGTYSYVFTLQNTNAITYVGTQLVGLGNSATSVINFSTFSSAGAAANVTDVGFANTTQFRITGFYATSDA